MSHLLTTPDNNSHSFYCLVSFLIFQIYIFLIECKKSLKYFLILTTEIKSLILNIFFSIFPNNSVNSCSVTVLIKSYLWHILNRFSYYCINFYQVTKMD